MADDVIAKRLKLVRARLAVVQGQILAADATSLDDVMLEANLEAITQMDHDHQEYVMEMMETIAEEDLASFMQEVAKFDRDYGELNIQIRRKLKVLRTPVKVETNGSPENNRSDALPPIPMPSFGGNFCEFMSFREQFEKRVASKTNMDDSVKLSYLRSALHGDAASIQSSTDTFESLWAALKSRYQVKRLLSESHINQLFAIKRMGRESAAELQRILDVVVKNLRVLNSLELPLDRLSEQIIINIVVSKLDEETQKALKVTQKANELPSWEETFQFLQGRGHALGTLELARPSTSKGTEKYANNRSHALHASTSESITCPLCKEDHFLNQCKKFRQLSPEKRLETAVNFGICTNCLRESHSPKECNGGSCRKCKGNHNTFLHQVADEKPADQNPSGQTVSMHTSVSLSASKKVMLSTVLLQILDVNGRPHVCRTLLDSGSEPNMMSERLAHTLKLTKIPTSTSLNGVNGSKPIRNRVQATIKSMASNFVEKLEFIIKTIPNEYPSTFVDTKKWKIPAHIKLADPGFGKPGPIDLLLGAEIFFELLTHEKVNLDGALPPLQGTVFGWIVAGRLYHHRQTPENDQFGFVATTDDLLHDSVRKFWELENTPTKNALTVEERQVEQHFIETHRRDASGRYVVSLPTKPSIAQLGDSEKMARRRFTCLEKRLLRHPELKIEYANFMEEYIRLGHMAEAAPNTCGAPNPRSYFLPHHAVLRPDSITTKLRVVFDASAKTSTGLSLNDGLKVGPTIQQDLFEIIVRFRKHQVALSADVSKMYRQILVDTADQPLQKIVWRFEPYHDLKVYHLKTVTYGTACAPFLATRSLLQLADDEQSSFPEAAQVTKKDFYVDDLLTGCSSEEEARTLQTQLVSMLQRGGF
jgi:hypothetical protein